MSDYLGRIVARTLSPQAIVRPQLLSPFEPPRMGRGILQQPDTGVAPSGAAEAIEAASVQDHMIPPGTFGQTVRDAGQAQGLLTAHSERAPRATHPPAPSASPAPKHNPPGRGAPLFPASVDTLSEAGSHTSEAIQPLPSQPPAIARTQAVKTWASNPDGEDAGSERKSRADGREANDSVKGGIPAPGAAETITPPAVRPLPERSSDGLPGGPRTGLQAPPAPAAATDPQPRSARIKPIPPASIATTPRLLPPPAPQREPAVEKPSIHVTIGRVEVRATPPAARARPPAAQPRVMSLDEYLRGRTPGGSR
jgi:hypothetical protein